MNKNFYHWHFYIYINFGTAPMVQVVIGALEILDEDDDDDKLITDLGHWHR